MDFASIIMLVAFVAIFYFLVIRPENKRKKQAQEMRDSIKKGDAITTIGGLKGKVVLVTDETIVFETSEDRVRIEIAKWGISSNDTAAAANAAAKKNGKKGQAEDKADAIPETVAEEASSKE